MLFKSKNVVALGCVSVGFYICAMIFNYYRDLMGELKKNLGGIL